jgi:hypothetical protein
VRENQQGKLDPLTELRGIDGSMASWRAKLRLATAASTEVFEYTLDQSYEERM